MSNFTPPREIVRRIKAGRDSELLKDTKMFPRLQATEPAGTEKAPPKPKKVKKEKKARKTVAA